MTRFLAVALVSLSAACTSTGSKNPSEPSGPLPAIAFSVSPSSGKSPLTVEIRWNVTNCTRAELTSVGDVSCNGSLTRTITATTEYELKAYNGAESSKQRQTATITP